MRPAGRRAAPAGCTMSLVTLVLSQPAAEIPFGVTAAVWVITERILSFRDLRSGAWKSRQDAGSYSPSRQGSSAGSRLGWCWRCARLWPAGPGLVGNRGTIRCLGRDAPATVGGAHPGPTLYDDGGGPARAGGSHQRAVQVRPPPSYLGVMILLGGFGLALGDLASATVMVVLPALGLMCGSGWRRQLSARGSETVTSSTAGPLAASPLDLVERRLGDREGLPLGVPEPRSGGASHDRSIVSAPQTLVPRTSAGRNYRAWPRHGAHVGRQRASWLIGRLRVCSHHSRRSWGRRRGLLSCHLAGQARRSGHRSALRLAAEPLPVASLPGRPRQRGAGRLSLRFNDRNDRQAAFLSAG